MSIEVSVRHGFDKFRLAADFASAGRLTAIFGASGSGKTTLVNAIAGLVRPARARIVVDDTVLVDTQRHIDLPVHRRRIGYVFQDARLFPHLTVEQNLKFGRWFTPRGERYADLGKLVELLGIGHLLARNIQGLSGGERQRVAIGRALLASPRLLLMDEPLAALDQARKAEILPHIERLRDELRIPIVYVSHALAEVKRLATDIVVLSGGTVTAAGPAGDIAQRLDLIPDSERDEGGAFLDMMVVAHDPQYDMTRLRSAAGEAWVTSDAGRPGELRRVQIRARDVMIAIARPEGISALNVFRGRITALVPSGPASVEVHLDCAGSPLIARITRQSRDALGLAEGLDVYAIVKAVSVGPSAAAPAA